MANVPDAKEGMKTQPNLLEVGETDLQKLQEDLARVQTMLAEVGKRNSASDLALISSIKDNANVIVDLADQLGAAEANEPDQQMQMSGKPTMTGVAKPVDEAIMARPDVTKADKAAAVDEYGDVQFADEKNKKYPLDSEDHIRSAWNYIGQERNAAKYDTAEVETIKNKIVAAWKKKIDKAGPPSAQESVPIAANLVESSKKLRTIYLAEVSAFDAAPSDWQPPVDHVFDVTLIKPGWSANGRYYSRQVLAKAAPVFEGTKAYADHPGKEEEKNRPERSVRDITGYYTDVRQSDDGALRGKLHVVGAARDWLSPLIIETLTKKNDLVGLSINALGKTAMGEVEGKKGIVVEDIVKGNSTDVVTTPAAGGRFERLAASDDGFTADLLQALDYTEWREARPEFAQRLREELKTLRQDEALKDASAQMIQLREQIAEQEKRFKELEEAKRADNAALSDLRAQVALREREVSADKLLANSRLPNAWQSAFRPQLLAESNTGLWPQMLNAEWSKASAFRTTSPVAVRGAGQSQPQPASNPVAQLLGIQESHLPKPNESAEEWARRVAQYR